MDQNYRILEICAENLKSAEMAQEGGADRIELCQGLEIGGITPSIGLIKMAKKVLLIPIFVLIRPRGGDFTYSEEEIQQMEENMNSCLSLKVDGFVFGALRNGTIDEEVCCRLLEAANGLPVTFHRAFDVCSDNDALKTILNLGFSRILTSGHAKTAYEGMKEIKSLIDEAESKITIMPGCGINCENLKQIVEYTNATEYHASAQESYENQHFEESVVKGTIFYPLTSSKVVKLMKDILRN